MKTGNSNDKGADFPSTVRLKETSERLLKSFCEKYQLTISEGIEACVIWSLYCGKDRGPVDFAKVEYVKKCWIEGFNDEQIQDGLRKDFGESKG